MRRQEAAAVAQRVAELSTDAPEIIDSADVIEHFAAHDEIVAARQRVAREVQTHEGHVLPLCTAIRGALERNRRNVGSDERIDPRRERGGDVPFGTPDLQCAADRMRRQQRERLLVLRASYAVVYRHGSEPPANSDSKWWRPNI